MLVEPSESSIYSKIYDAILEKGGITIGVVGSNSFVVPESGYAVSPFPASEVRVHKKNFLYDDVYSFIHHNKSLLGNAGCYFGAWSHGRDYVFDVVKVVDCLGEALKLGRANGQEAIWDITNDLEINLR